MYFIYTVGFLPVAGADVFHDLLMLDDGVVKTALGRQGVYPELLGLGVYALVYVAYNAVSAKGMMYWWSWVSVSDIACQIVIFIFLCELVKYLHKLPDIGSSNSLNGVFYGIAFKEYPDLVNFLYILYRKLLYEYSLVWIFNGQTFVHKLFSAPL